MSEWPKHEDGTNKRVGDMTPEEKREVFAASAARLKAELEQPKVSEAIQRFLED